MKKRLRALILAIILSITIFPIAGSTKTEAATTSVCHILTGSTKVYSNTRLSRKQGTVYQSQEITIYSYNNSYARIRYKSGRKNSYGYIKRSAFLTTTKGRTVRPTRGLITYYRQSTKARYGNFTTNMAVTVYGTTGSYTQVSYKTPKGSIKFALVKTSDARKYLTGTSSTSTASKKNGWQTSGGRKYYYKNGSKVSWWQYIDGAWYYFGGSDRHMYTGWFTDGGKKYYLQSNGKMVTGTVKIGNTWYTFNSSGAYVSTVSQKPAETTATTTASSSTGTGASSSERQNVVSYMRAMATIRWTPSTTMTYWNGSGRKWVRGTVYTGIPYSQYSRTTSLEEFRRQLSGSTYRGPSGRTTYKGTDCSSSVSLAWKQANSSIGIRWTGSMTPGNSGIKKVGNYVTNRSNTKRSCTSSGKSKMYAAYRQLQPGDAVVTHGSSYHVRLVTSVSSNGVTCIEQSGLVTANRSSWKVNQYYSFASLYNSGYVPITMTNW